MSTVAPMDLAPLSPVELSLLAHKNRIREAGPCRVCGAALTISSMGGGDATRYHCSSPEADILKAGAADRDAGESSWSGPRSRAAQEHRDRSEERIAFHGDRQVLALVAEVRRLKAQLGEDTSVPVGTEHYPYGHGKHRCWYRVVHEGDDVWTEASDHDYTHDKSHEHLDVED